MSGPSILLANDDGVESIDFRVFYDVLSEFAGMTAVTPATDQSTVGREMSIDAVIVEHGLGYAPEGTLVDCTVIGLGALCLDVDMVVSGINKRVSIDAYVLGRSGTVSAAVETAFFDVPTIALPLHAPAGDDLPWHEKATDPWDFREVTNAALHLVKYAEPAGVFEQCDYFNVNASVSSPDGGPADMQVTVPSELYDMAAEFESGTVRLHDRAWERMEIGDTLNPDGIDRRVVVEGRVSVSPLTASHTTYQHEALDVLAETYLERAKRETGNKAYTGGAWSTDETDDSGSSGRGCWSGTVTDFLVTIAVLFSLPLVILLLGWLLERFF